MELVLTVVTPCFQKVTVLLQHKGSISFQAAQCFVLGFGVGVFFCEHGSRRMRKKP